MPGKDDAYLLDMLIAARKALGHISGLSWEDFAESDLHQDAVLWQLGIIGEAARLVSSTTREAHPEIPWSEIVGMRNRLIHEYFDIDLQRVWETVRQDLDVLIRLLEPLVPPQ